MRALKKVSANVAYTTPSGRLHIGHGLGYTIADVALKYSSLKNNAETFLGFGMHSTGKDLLNIINKLSADENLPAILSRYNISLEKRDEIISKSTRDKQVDSLVQEYKTQYQSVLSKMGVAVNFDSFFSTNQEGNQKFTQWTLNRLNDAGLIVKTATDRPYCVLCDDIKHIDVDQSEVTAIGKVDWENVRLIDGEIQGGSFECRLHNGVPIIVKSRDERAINYADFDMQNKTIALSKNMTMHPKKYKSDLEGIITSRLSKPFERKADDNIGAISPFDESKRVEALSDSNIYMEYFPISQLINKGVLSVENLSDTFFDFVFLGKGNVDDVSKETGLDAIAIDYAKNHIESILPVDINVAGFEHISVHLPFSLFTHAAVLPEKYFLPEYIITSHITKEGAKMSKSKGNVTYLDELLDLTKSKWDIDYLSTEAGFDSIRFFLSYYQSLDKDFDWNNNLFISTGVRGVLRYSNAIQRAADFLSDLETSDESLTELDKWFSTFDQKSVNEITLRMDERDSRKAMVSLVDLRTKALSSYILSEKPNQKLLSDFILNQINMGYPVMPRVSEEFRSLYFPKSKLAWPVATEAIFPEEFAKVEHQQKKGAYVGNLIGEVNALLGKLIGRKEIFAGDDVTVVLPTKYQLDVLNSLIKKLPKQLNINLEVNPTSENIFVK